MIVIDLDVMADGLLELPRAVVRAAADVFLGERGEPAFDWLSHDAAVGAKYK